MGVILVFVLKIMVNYLLRFNVNVILFLDGCYPQEQFVPETSIESFFNIFDIRYLDIKIYNSSLNKY